MGIITKRNGKFLIILGMLLIIIGFFGTMILYKLFGDYMAMPRMYMSLDAIFILSFIPIGPMLAVIGILMFIVSSKRMPSKLMDILKSSVGMRTKISFLARQLAINEKDVIRTISRLRSKGEPVLIDSSTLEAVYNPTPYPPTLPPSQLEMQAKPLEKKVSTPVPIARGICDICNGPLKHGEGYLLHGKLVAKANYMTEEARRLDRAFGMSPEESQTNLMARARVDTTPWMACDKCITHFLDTEQEKAQAHELAKRFWQGEKIPLHILPTTSSLLEKAKKPEAQKKTMVCRKCGKEVEYDETRLPTVCPYCMTYNPGWIHVAPGSKDARAQKHKEKAGDHYSQGEKRQAISEFKKAAEIDRTDATIFNNIGAIYGELGDYDEALKYLRKALEIDPDLGPAKRQLKRIQEIVGK